MYFFTDQKRKFRTIFNFLALIVLISISAVSFAAAENSAKQDSPSASNSVEASADNDKASVSIQSLNKAAFGSMAQTMLPMSPEQIKRLRGLFNQTQAAAATTPGTPPRPTISSQYVKLEPGATPTVIRLAEGYVTTLAFLDSTGQSWPVDN